MTIDSAFPSQRYAKVIQASKRVHWEIDRDLMRGRSFDMTRKFLPDGLSLVGELPFLTASEQRLFSQVQGRTYANLFGLVERFISAKILEVSREHWLGDQAEDVGVGAALHLREQALLVGRQERQLADLGQAIGQELAAEV